MSLDALMNTLKLGGPTTGKQPKLSKHDLDYHANLNLGPIDDPGPAPPSRVWTLPEWAAPGVKNQMGLMNWSDSMYIAVV